MEAGHDDPSSDDPVAGQLSGIRERESWCERLRERDGQGRREGMTSGPWVTDGSSGHRKKKMMTTMDSLSIQNIW